MGLTKFILPRLDEGADLSNVEELNADSNQLCLFRRTLVFVLNIFTFRNASG